MRSILVATDFSTRSDRALRRAALLAGQYGASLVLVHVVDDDQPAYLVDAHLGAASDLLRQTAQTISDVDGLDTDVVIDTGDPFEKILRAAEEVEPDLIVVGPHRRQLLDVFVGTTAERTIRWSRRPVLMANAMPAGRYNRSLVALDMDESSRVAAQMARGMDFVGRTEIVALHMFDAPALGLVKRSMGEPEAVGDYLVGEERRNADTFAAFLAETGLVAARHILQPQRGSPSAAILGCAEQEDADLIVVGSRQAKGMRRLLIGSVAEEVLRSAERDVLVIPAAVEGEARLETGN